jgi:hypothetical protein
MISSMALCWREVSEKIRGGNPIRIQILGKKFMEKMSYDLE